MRRLIKLLSPLIISILFLSCNNLYKQESSITLNSKDAVTKAIRVAREAIAEGDTPNSEDPETEGMYTTEELEAITNAFDFYVDFTVKVSGQGFSKEDSKSLSLNYADYINGSQLSSSDIGDIKFQNVPVGLNATVRAVINSGIRLKSQEALLTLLNFYEEVNLDDYPNQEELLEYLTSLYEFNFAFAGSEEITVHEGNNPVTIRMQYIDPDDPNNPLNPDNPDNPDNPAAPISGTGEIEAEMPLQFTIEIDATATTTYYKNKNEITVSLLDDSGEAVSVSNADWTFELRYGNTVLPNTYYSYDETSGKLTLGNEQDLPTRGTYQLAMMAVPKGSYENCESASATFSINYIDADYYTLDAAYNSDEIAVLLTNIQSENENAFIKFSGAASQDYHTMFQSIKDDFAEALSNFQHLIDFDFSGVTTSVVHSELGRGLASNEFSYFTQLRSIILPDDLTSIAGNAFSNCSNLEKVVFGSGIQSIDSSSTFAECPKLTNVIIPEDAPLICISDNTFYGDNSLKALSLPATFVALGSNALGNIETLILADTSGTWYYTSETLDWSAWWYSHTATPPEVSNSDTPHGLLDDLKNELTNFPETGSVAEKLLFAAQNTNYYFYCAK